EDARALRRARRLAAARSAPHAGGGARTDPRRDGPGVGLAGALPRSVGCHPRAPRNAAPLTPRGVATRRSIVRARWYVRLAWQVGRTSRICKGRYDPGCLRFHGRSPTVRGVSREPVRRPYVRTSLETSHYCVYLR